MRSAAGGAVLAAAGGFGGTAAGAPLAAAAGGGAAASVAGTRHNASAWAARRCRRPSRGGLLGLHVPARRSGRKPGAPNRWVPAVCAGPGSVDHPVACLGLGALNRL